MAEQTQKKTKGETPKVVDNVATLARCPVCGTKPHKAGFCSEHFMWFKFGLVDKKGQKPLDFDKKFLAFQKRYKKVA
jgi:hypothetical protein